MSMSPVPNDFDQLRRLLALKRHETPPPGYFHGFSREVILRIKAGELGNEAAASPWSFGVNSWFQRIWAALDARPVFAGAFGVAICGFFTVGALVSNNNDAVGATEPAPPIVVTRAPAPVWETPKGEAEYSSIIGQPNYQPPAGSLFQEIKAVQQGVPQQVAFPVRVSYP